MMKKFLSVVLALCLAISLVACSSTTSTSTGTASASGTANTDATDAPYIRIGGIGPVTGGAAVYGTAVKNAMELAIEEINAENGSIKFEGKFEDDEHDAEKAVNAYNTLKDWGMQILMGTVTSTPCIAVAAEAEADNMFVLTPSASSSKLEGYSTVYQICFTDPNQGVASADYIADNDIAQKIAIIYDSSDVYSTGIHDKFVQEAQAQGLEIVSDEAFTSDSKTDFSVQVQKAKSAGAELVFLPIYYSEAALILNTANQMDYAPIFCGCDGLDGLLAVKNFNTDLAEGVMLLTPFAADSTDEKTQAFVKAYEEKYGDTPNQFAADAYDAIYVLRDLCEQAGVTADMSASDICDLLTATITTISFDGLTGEDMTWTATGEVNKAPKAVKIVNGQYTAMD
jgi:branched-chain amino acid transport system substrate-binding protein